MNFKNICIGKMIENGVAENGIEISRICNFLKCSKDDIKQMYCSNLWIQRFYYDEASF
ncbi:hypothetical protein SAMN05421768_10627 [Chryseobacterium joostei]|uniref:HTH cro/C1-type domain-containing protein n=1 Tax=Chryseobacterium joostei TaxID=112234 RepID=A0A1N7ILC6_9FLAO|nr:hypothetical protein SAMN05421768_10627 [Chryseobacterium joostei]